MLTVAIGPETDRPTWYWIGFNLARELTKYFNVRIFRRHGPAHGDVIVTVKEPLEQIRVPGARVAPVIYFLADYFRDEQVLVGSKFLRTCSALVVHSRQLQELAERFHPRVCLLAHDDKYVLPELAQFRQSGHILWVGFSDYIVVLQDWLKRYPLGYPLVILTDRPGRFAVPGRVEQLHWTPTRQFEYMRTAKGALDVKGSSFNQRMKPPEKVQTFIASGIPTACNLNSPVYDSAVFPGFNLVDASDQRTWFSKAYYDATQRYALDLRQRMSLAVIGWQMMTLINDVYYSDIRLAPYSS
jgi:hypothetical protein